MPSSLQILVTLSLFFSSFGCVILSALNFHFCWLTLLSKNVGDEINDLVEPEVDDEKYFTPNGGAMMKWWIPLNRASRIVQEELLPGNTI